MRAQHLTNTMKTRNIILLVIVTNIFTFVGTVELVKTLRRQALADHTRETTK